MEGKRNLGNKKYIGVIFPNIVGGQLYPLNKNLPVSNLPVGNKKLIIYQLQQLANISEMDTVIVLYTQESIKIKQYLESQFLPKFTSYPHNIQFFQIDDYKPEYFCLQKLLNSSLYEGFEQIKGMFIIPPNVISSVKFSDLLDNHIEKQADLTLLLKEKKQYGKDEKKPDFQLQPQIDVALVSEKGEVLSLKSVQNYEFGEAKPNIPASVYHRIKRATFLRVFDSTIYIFGQRIIKIAKNLVNEQIASFKNDFVDLIVRNQTNTTLLDYAHDKSVRPLKVFSKVEGQNQYIRRISCQKIYQSINLDSLIRGQKQKEVLLPNIYTQPLDEKLMMDYKGCLIGKGSEMETAIKVTRTVIQNGCKIGKNVQICNSIIMSGSIIEEGCKITNSIIGPNCLLKSQSTLLSCKLAMNCVVEKGTNNENLVLIPAH